MFTKFIDWRIENDVENILTSFKFDEAEAVMNEYSRAFFGVDKIGRPLYVDKAGYVLVDQLFKITTEERVTKDVIRLYEDLLKVKFLACSDLHDR